MALESGILIISAAIIGRLSLPKEMKAKRE